MVLRLLLIILLHSCALAGSEGVWSNATYPNEQGFQKRMSPMLERIRQQGFGQRSQARSTCPDTGRPVRTWAVEGELIISPYTGRRYTQGPTGYFGPQKRNAQGHITRFGGDPLKYDLPPVTAELLLFPDNEDAKAFVSIPGNLNQQYHFAAKNWARFYSLLADTMGFSWQAAFQQAVGQYSENRRPSDGRNEHASLLSKAHNLVGEVGELLGGNTRDGGTENHKTMWRTTALLYAQLFPAGSAISGYPVQTAEEMTASMIADYLQRLLHTGNGEYDSQTYYPHSIEGFLNLFDFSTKDEYRQLAKFALDYYFLTYGLKVIDGVLAGAQKRGYVPGQRLHEMDIIQWAYFNQTSKVLSQAQAPIHLVTTRYRPNRVICNIVKKRVTLPFEAFMTRPYYHMDHKNGFQESFYASHSYHLGNVAMSIVDNPTQQVVWSLVARGKRGPLGFGGAQPRRLSPSGHSPYTQTLHKKSALVLLSGPTDSNIDDSAVLQFRDMDRINQWHLPFTDTTPDYERKNRFHYAKDPLQTLAQPDVADAAALNTFMRKAPYSAASWLFIPKEVDKCERRGKRVFIHAQETFVAVIPVTEDVFFIRPAPEIVKFVEPKSLSRLLTEYSILVVSGRVSGYIIDAGERSRYRHLDGFIQAVEDQTLADLSRLKEDLTVTYRSLTGDLMEMTYRPDGLRAAARINGEAIDYNRWAEGAVYDSPYVKIKDGRLWVSDERESYEVAFKGKKPIWRKSTKPIQP